MALFQYTGRTTTGEAVRGRTEALSPSSVAADLSSKGIVPVRIAPVGSGSAAFRLKLERAWYRRRIALIDIIMFCRQMSALTRSGVPITRALRGLSETLRNPEFGRILGEVADQLERGHELASALQRHSDIFSSLFVSVIHIGESSGHLEESFEQLHGYLTLEDETRKRIKGALRYPTMVCGSMVVSIGVINAFVVPPFAKLFAGLGAELPWATQLLISSSAFTSRFWHVGLCGIALLTWLVRKWARTPEGKVAWHQLQLRIPAIGSILRRALLARFCRTLAITLGAGLPVTQCLSIASRAVDNEWVGKKILTIRNDIESGGTLTASANASGLFTPLVLQMLSVGEETGAVEDTLTEVADFYEREVDYDLKTVGDAIEPALMLFVGALMLVLALGVYLPMWEMASASRG